MKIKLDKCLTAETKEIAAENKRKEQKLESIRSDTAKIRQENKRKEQDLQDILRNNALYSESLEYLQYAGDLALLYTNTYSKTPDSETIGVGKTLNHFKTTYTVQKAFQNNAKLEQTWNILEQSFLNNNPPSSIPKDILSVIKAVAKDYAKEVIPRLKDKDFIEANESDIPIIKMSFSAFGIQI